MELYKLYCFKENTRCARFEKAHKRNCQITEKYVKIANEEIFTCYMICMLVENKTFHPVFYFQKQPKRGVPKT